MDHQRMTTSVLRSTRSANYYELPMTISPTGSTISSASFEPSFASTWGSSSDHSSTASMTMRRVTNPDVTVDLNASFQFESSMNSNNRSNSDQTPHFQPSFAFDVNHLVSSLRRSASTSSMLSSKSSFTNSGGPSSSSVTANGRPERQSARKSSQMEFSSQQHIPQYTESPQHVITTADSRIEVVPMDPVLNRRGRRDALSGSDEHARAVPVPHDNQNSIINYSLNKKKKKPIAGMPLNSYVTPAVVASSNQYPPDLRQTTTITTRNGIEYTTEVPQPRATRVNSFYEESFTF